MGVYSPRAGKAQHFHAVAHGHAAAFGRSGCTTPVVHPGCIPASITDNYNGDFNEIKNNLNQCIAAVNALVSDANMLSDAAVAGHLDTLPTRASTRATSEKSCKA